MAEHDLKLVTTPSTSEQPGKFDLASLRLPQNFTETVNVKKLLTTVPVRKPGPQDFVRVHPGQNYRDNFAMIELKDDREMYLIHGHDLLGELAGEYVTVTLFTAITRQNVVFLWPVRLPDPDGKQMEWHRSMREAAETAMGRWVRVKAKMSLGAYEITAAESIMAEPEWPKEPFTELLRIGFRNRLIDTIDHQVIKNLRGL
jgi:hypothetical protein